MIYFTADLHLGHKNILKYCGRDFVNVEDMDLIITRNFVSVLSKGDILFMLGDISFSSTRAEKFLKTINELGVQIHYIWGNHDKGSKVKRTIRENVEWYGERKDIKTNGQRITLSHYKMWDWYKSNKDSWLLYGHSHGGSNELYKSMDVGVDCHKFYPVSLHSIWDAMKDKASNPIDHHGTIIHNSKFN